MDIVKNILKLAIKIQDLPENKGKLLKQLDDRIVVFEIARVILVGTDDGPDILAEFSRLHCKIQAVSADIKELGSSIDWVGASVQYASICNVIQLGMEYCNFISKYRAEHNAVFQKQYEDKLKRLCHGDQMMLALRTLFNGLTGRGEFTISILDTVYKKTRGHMRKVDEFCCNLLQLFVGGLAVLTTHETLMTGLEYARILEENHFSGSYDTILININTTLEKCKNEYLINAESDIAHILQHPSCTENAKIVQDIHATLSEKYNWVRFDCMLWDDCDSNLFSLCGDFISKLHYQGKCVAAFYYDDADTVYDTPYTHAWEQVNCNAKGIWGKLKTVNLYSVLAVKPVPASAAKSCEVIEQFKKGNIQFSGYAVWVSHVQRVFQFGRDYVVDAKCYSTWSIWNHSDQGIFRPDYKNDRTVYCRIKSVDRDFFRDPPAKEGCIIC